MRGEAVGPNAGGKYKEYRDWVTRFNPPVVNEESPVDGLVNSANLTGYSSSGPGVSSVMGAVILFVIGLVLITTVALPVLNTAFGSSNSTAVSSAVSSVAGSAYIVVVLSVLAAAAGTVFVFFKADPV